MDAEQKPENKEEESPESSEEEEAALSRMDSRSFKVKDIAGRGAFCEVRIYFFFDYVYIFSST